MSKKANAILMICIWGLFTFAKYYDLLSDKVFKPDAFDWFVLIGGPILIILEGLILWKALNEEKNK